MKTLISMIARLTYLVGATALFIMMLIVIVDIVLRSVFGSTLGFVEEVVGYLVVAVTIFGVSITFREGVLFRVGFLFDNLSDTLKQYLNVFYCLLGVVFCSTMAWYTALLVISSFKRGKIAATELQTPLYIPQVIIPVGFVIFLIFIFEKMFSKQKSDESKNIEMLEDSGE
uniref:TRAP transporter small permease n=1 Tax=Marinobacterium profundum TaxID=1714300 RepID=UPI000830F92F|nr:TRAP transporter small permease [Marinobacterium profundum]